MLLSRYTRDVGAIQSSMKHCHVYGAREVRHTDLVLVRIAESALLALFATHPPFANRGDRNIAKANPLTWRG